MFDEAVSPTLDVAFFYLDIFPASAVQIFELDTLALIKVENKPSIIDGANTMFQNHD